MINKNYIFIKIFIFLSKVIILRQNNLIKPNKKVSQIKPIKIIKIKYSDNKSTHMDNVNFYKKHYKKGNIENFYLSNGCNKTFSPGGGGTNSAITQISGNFFDIYKINIIYNNNLDFNGIYSSEKQKMNFNNIKLNAGSVLFSYYKHSFLGYNINGVYHITPNLRKMGQFFHK